MSRSDRLYALMQLLHDGQTHRARDLAEALGVTLRTIYRDIDTLRASGLQITGTQGTGYRAAPVLALAPVTLSPAELEALQLGIAVVSEAADPDLRAAALGLAAKIDNALPTGAVPAQDWALATYPFADAARGLGHLAPVRAAVQGRQKLRVTWRDGGQGARTDTLRPLEVTHWARVWMLKAWAEAAGAHVSVRLDLIDSVSPLPELFTDPG